MRVLDNIAATRARLAALVMRPRALVLRFYSRLPVGRMDPDEAEAFNEAIREAFQASPPGEGPRPLTPPSSRPRVSTLDAAPRAPLPPSPAPEVMTVQEPSATEQPTRRKASDTAPDFLLRTPASVAPVVDDFFDGLIRRVEGDR
jgi:hypothetical protein